MSQRDLFGELDAKITDPIVGLRIKLQPCRCGCDIARVVKGKWLMVPFCCDGCGAERGRLSYATIVFLHKTIELWGQPPGPIELKRGNYIETSSQLSGAGAEAQSTAPTRN
jgi:hypothetical protein